MGPMDVINKIFGSSCCKSFLCCTGMHLAMSLIVVFGAVLVLFILLQRFHIVGLGTSSSMRCRWNLLYYWVREVYTSLFSILYNQIRTLQGQGRPARAVVCAVSAPSAAAWSATVAIMESFDLIYFIHTYLPKHLIWQKEFPKKSNTAAAAQKATLIIQYH